MRRMNDKGFAIVGSAVIVALAIFMGFGATVIVQRGHLLHQAKLSGQRIARKSHESLTVSVDRESNSTDITITNNGSSTVTFNRLLLKQPDNRVVMMPSDSKFFDDLAGWWRFSEGSGDNAYDYSGNGNDGFLRGDPIWVDGWVGDGALEFDGNGDYVALDMSYQNGDSLPNFTVSVQYKTSVSGEGRFSNWSFLDFDRSEWFNVYIRGGNGKLGFSGCDGVNNPYDIYADTASNDGAGHGGAVVYNSGRDFVKFYLDGDSDGTETYSNVAPISDATPRYGFIGDGSEASSFDGGRNGLYFKGTIDEVMFFSRALEPDEISELSKCNVLLYPVSLTPLEDYTVTYPFRVDNQAAVGVYTRLGNTFWEGS